MKDKNALKTIRANCIDWYDFKENSNLLAIGDDWKEIIENDNVTIINEEAENLNEKFDYILVKDKIENLKIAEKYLKPNGTILLLMNNRFGVANFAGSDDFQSICEENCELLSKKEIENFLQKEGFPNYKFFYPLPKYDITNVIFSDDYLPEYHHSKLMNRNIYEENSMLVFDELKALKQLTKAGEFKNFTNSYLIEINPKTKIKFASFNNARKKEFRLCTKIYQDYVVKESINPVSEKHIDNMKNNIQNLKEQGFEILDREENGKIISPYISQQNFYQIILETIYNDKIEETYNLIEKWFELIKSKFANSKTSEVSDILKDCSNSENLTIVKCAYLDLVFENTFLMGEKFAFFDQEWTMNDLPLEFILYRAINNIYVYHSEIEKKIARSEFLKRFHLVEYLELFEKIENEIQKVIIDDSMVKIYEASSYLIKDIQEIKQFINLKDNELRDKIKLLEIEEKKKEEYIERLTKARGDLEAKVKLLEIEEKKKEKYIEKLTKEKGDLEAEDKRKAEYIEQIKLEKENEINNFKNVDAQKDEIIHHLNEIIKVKEHEIEVYENMKTVKIVKKLRGNKN